MRASLIRFFCGWVYPVMMKLAHRYHWHYAPPIYPEGDVQLWCKWCGFRQTIRRRFTGDDASREAAKRMSGALERGGRWMDAG